MDIDIKINPLPLLKKEGERLMQCIDLLIYVESQDSHNGASLEVTRGEIKFNFHLGLLKKGMNKNEIFLPEVLSPSVDEFVFRCGESKIVQRLAAKPVRRRVIYLVLHSHTDLGFTAPVSDVAQIHNDNTDAAVLYCKETESWPEGSKFKWTCEVSWQIQNYIRDRTPEKIADLINQIKKGNMAVGAFYSGQLTEILGHEQAARAFYYSAKLRKEYGINIDTAMLCDVPGCTKGFVQIMAKSGIKNFIMADNNFIAPFLLRTDLPRPFYWLGDDDTKVLSWYTDHPFYAYIEGENYGLSQSYSQTREKLPKKLIRLEEDGYEYDEFQLQYAFDNFRIEFRPAAVVREWNERWAYPKIKLSTASEFLTTINEKYSARIPERRGDWTNWWAGIVNGFPAETAKSRSLHTTIPSLEILNSSLSVIDDSIKFHSDNFEKMFEKTLAFDEHSGSGMVWEPKSDEQQRQALMEGYGFIEEPFFESTRMEETLTDKLAGLIENPSSEEKAVVFNPSNFTRTEITRIKKEDGKTYQFLAEEIPPLGYKIFSLTVGENQIKTSQKDEHGKLIIENSHFSVTADRNTAKIISIFCKTAQKEIVKEDFNYPMLYVMRPKVPFQMGKFIPELYNGDEVPGDLIRFDDRMRSEIEFADESLLIKHFFESDRWLDQKIFIDGEQVKFENIFNGKLLNDIDFLKKYLNDSGLLYMRFSFDPDFANIRYEAPCSVIAPRHEQFKGVCMDYTAVQSWLQMDDGVTSIIFSSIDTPLIDIGEPALLKYRKEFPSSPRDLYVRLVSLNEFNGRSKSPYSNDEDLLFRFSVSASVYDEKSSLIAASKFGEKNSKKLLASIVKPGNKGILRRDQSSFAEVEPDHLQVLTIKKAEDNEDLIIRLRETSGNRTNAAIKFSHKEIHEAYRTAITEEILEKLKVNENSVSFSASPFGVETIRLKFK